MVLHGLLQGQIYLLFYFGKLGLGSVAGAPRKLRYYQNRKPSSGWAALPQRRGWGGVIQLT
jgi:hypothetical protein